MTRDGTKPMCRSQTAQHLEELGREERAGLKRALVEMPLQKLREARHLTQIRLANVMGVSQSEVSKIERRADVYVSTLGSYVEAMGGRLEVTAIFPDGGVVEINQFESV